MPRLLLTISIVFFAALAEADGGESPFYGEVYAMLHADFTNGTDSHKVAYTHTEAEWGTRLVGGLSLNNTIKLERLEHEYDDEREEGHGHTKSSFLDRHILIIEELTFNYDEDEWGFYLGKFYPTVGFVYDEFPGINAHHTVEEYAIHERIGIGAIRRFGRGQLELATFFADTTFMSDALLTNRRRTRKNDGGVANTESLSSLAISLRGDLPEDDNGLLSEPIYRLGYARQAAGKPASGRKESVESRYAVGLGGNFNFASDWVLRGLGEAVWVKNFRGEKDRRRIYGTVSLRLKHGDWHWHAFHAGKFNRAEERREDENDYLNELSVGYDLDEYWAIDWGYSWIKDAGINSQLINLMLSYKYDWGNDHQPYPPAY